jgi:hypothetical protein
MQTKSPINLSFFGNIGTAGLCLSPEVWRFQNRAVV